LSMTTQNIVVTYKDGKQEVFRQINWVADYEHRVLQVADWSECGHGETTKIPFDCIRKWK
jgi:hypothetical protein